MGKTKDYVERMDKRVNFLETDFFSDIMGDTDFENLTESQITAMQKKNGFNFKQLQAYKNRLATENINRDYATKQAEIEAEKQRTKQQQTQAQDIQDLANIKQIQDYTGKSLSDYRMSRPASERQYTGHGKSGMGRDKSELMASGGRAGLATMFTRRR